MDFDELAGTLKQLRYRFEMMDLADRIRQYLDLEMPSIRTLEERQCVGTHRCSSYALHEISRKRIFGSPAPEHGREFMKPLYYLAAAMVHWSEEQIDRAITKLKDRKHSQTSRMDLTI